MILLLTGGSDVSRVPLLMLVLQNVLSLFNLGVVLRWWAREAQPSRRQWCVVLGLLFFPAQFIYANALMSEVVLQSAVLALAIYGIRFWESEQPADALKMVAATGLALLLKPVFYPFAGLMAVFGLGWAWRRRHLLWLGIGLLPLLITGLYMSWNLQRTGYFHFSSISDINLLHYNAAGVVRHLHGPAAEEQWVGRVLREANAQPDFARRQRCIQQRAGAMLAQHPIIYAKQHLQGMVALFLDPGRFDLSQFLRLSPLAGGGLLQQLRAGGPQALLRALPQLPLGLLALLAAVALANAVRLALAVRGLWWTRKSGGGWWLAVLLLYVAGLTGPLGAARFLVPVWPLLLLLALWGLKPGRLVPEQLAPVREDAA